MSLSSVFSKVVNRRNASVALLLSGLSACAGKTPVIETVERVHPEHCYTEQVTTSSIEEDDEKIILGKQSQITGVIEGCPERVQKMVQMREAFKLLAVLALNEGGYGENSRKIAAAMNRGIPEIRDLAKLVAQEAGLTKEMLIRGEINHNIDLVARKPETPEEEEQRNGASAKLIEIYTGRLYADVPSARNMIIVELSNRGIQLVEVERILEDHYSRKSVPKSCHPVKSQRPGVREFVCTNTPSTF